MLNRIPNSVSLLPKKRTLAAFSFAVMITSASILPAHAQDRVVIDLDAAAGMPQQMEMAPIPLMDVPPPPPVRVSYPSGRRSRGEMPDDFLPHSPYGAPENMPEGYGKPAPMQRQMPEGFGEPDPVRGQVPPPQPTFPGFPTELPPSDGYTTREASAQPMMAPPPDLSQVTTPPLRLRHPTRTRFGTARRSTTIAMPRTRYEPPANNAALEQEFESVVASPVQTLAPQAPINMAPMQPPAGQRPSVPFGAPSRPLDQPGEQWIALPPSQPAVQPAPQQRIATQAPVPARIAKPAPAPAAPQPLPPTYKAPVMAAPTPFDPPADEPVAVAAAQDTRTRFEAIVSGQPVPQPENPEMSAQFDAMIASAPRKQPAFESPSFPDMPSMDAPTEMVADDEGSKNEFEALIHSDPSTIVVDMEADSDMPFASMSADMPELPAGDESFTTAMVATDPVITKDLPSLSVESKKILESVPSGLDSPKVIRTPDPVIIRRVDPSSGNIPHIDYRVHEELHLKIEMRQPDPSVHQYLEDAYENLLEGKREIAIGYYKEALEIEPTNELALFGIATTYHKAGMMNEARAQYGALLEVNPTHREGLNNFMALLSEESPTEALGELQKLEKSNPDFSPIPAQMGIVLNKLGKHEEAAERLVHALKLTPDNRAYKYNLAITMDKLGKYAEATDLYLELVEAYRRGATDIPGDVKALQERAIFLSQKKAS